MIRRRQAPHPLCFRLRRFNYLSIKRLRAGLATDIQIGERHFLRRDVAGFNGVRRVSDVDRAQRGERQLSPRKWCLGFDKFSRSCDSLLMVLLGFSAVHAVGASDTGSGNHRRMLKNPISTGRVALRYWLGVRAIGSSLSGVRK